MIYAIVGSYGNFHCGSIRGNGKTISAVYYMYKDFLNGRNIYTNFYTSFSQMVTINQLLNIFENKRLRNSSVGITEAQVYFHHHMTKEEKEKLFRRFISQSRKQDNDIFLDTQIFRKLNDELRDHVDKILIPEKIHLDGSPCHIDNCKEKHIINVYDIEDLTVPITSFNSWIVGQLYDTNEITLDSFESEKPSKLNLTKKQLEAILKEVSKND